MFQQKFKHLSRNLKTRNPSWLIVFFISNQSCQSEEFSIEKSEFITRVIEESINNKLRIFKIEGYFVSGYSNTSEMEFKIDSFFCMNKDTMPQKYDDYVVYFYKKTKITNDEYLKKAPREYDRYSSEYDLLYKFTYNHNPNGISYYYKYKYKGKGWYEYTETPGFKCD